jgi:hypothetical protein
LIYLTGEKKFISEPQSTYMFRLYTGKQRIRLEAGDGAFLISENAKDALFKRGECDLISNFFCTVIRGYAPAERSCALEAPTNLPYINGCSTRQLFAPERPGDPTWQMLHMPAHTKEQMHHIHPTARVVYVYRGRGLSLVGMAGHCQTTELVEGMTCVLPPMCPHHFETKDSDLIVLPVQVWSSVAGQDFNHPMFIGTLKVDF